MGEDLKRWEENEIANKTRMTVKTRDQSQIIMFTDLKFHAHTFKFVEHCKMYTTC